MANPVTPSDIDAAVPSVFANSCAGFKSLFLLGPLIKEFWHWAFTSAGEATEDFKALFVSIGVPTGAIIDWPIGVSIPAGYLEANGQIVARAAYPGLFAVYGTTFGGDASGTTFGLPNIGGRFRMGRDGSNPAGGTGGEAEVSLDSTQNGRHSHTTYALAQGTSAINKVWGSGVSSPTNGSVYANNHGLAQVGTAEVPIETVISQSGDSAPHENLPPYFTCVVIIKT